VVCARLLPRPGPGLPARDPAAGRSRDAQRAARRRGTADRPALAHARLPSAGARSASDAGHRHPRRARGVRGRRQRIDRRRDAPPRAGAPAPRKVGVARGGRPRLPRAPVPGAGRQLGHRARPPGPAPRGRARRADRRGARLWVLAAGGDPGGRDGRGADRPAGLRPGPPARRRRRRRRLERLGAFRLTDRVRCPTAGKRSAPRTVGAGAVVPRPPADAGLGARRRLVRRGTGLPDRAQRPRGVGHHRRLHRFGRPVLGADRSSDRHRPGTRRAGADPARAAVHRGAWRRRCRGRDRRHPSGAARHAAARPRRRALASSDLARAGCRPRLPGRAPGRLVRDVFGRRSAPGPDRPSTSSTPMPRAGSGGSWSAPSPVAARATGPCRFPRGTSTAAGRRSTSRSTRSREPWIPSRAT